MNKRYTKDYQLDLVWKYQATLDDEYFSELLKCIRRYLDSFVQQRHREYSGRIEFADLRQSCICGMLEALKRFDIDKNVHFLTYASLWMRAECFQLYRRSLPIHISDNKMKELHYGKDTQRRKEINLMMSTIPIESVSALEAGPLRADRDYTWESIEKLMIDERVLMNLTEDELKVFWSIYEGYNVKHLTYKYGINRQYMNRQIWSIRRKISSTIGLSQGED